MVAPGNVPTTTRTSGVPLIRQADTKPRAEGPVNSGLQSTVEISTAATAPVATAPVPAPPQAAPRDMAGQAAEELRANGHDVSALLAAANTPETMQASGTTVGHNGALLMEDPASRGVPTDLAQARQIADQMLQDHLRFRDEMRGIGLDNYLQSVKLSREADEAAFDRFNQGQIARREAQDGLYAQWATHLNETNA